jgi:proteic killer suppression protein
VHVAILSIRDRRLEELMRRRIPKGFPAELAAVTRRKLVMLDAAERLSDLTAPPANRLEALKDNRLGQHSIRVNDQFRLCFRWTPDGPADVEFVNYH